MKSMFVIAGRIGDGLTPETRYRPWFRDSVSGWSGTNYKAVFLGNVFAEDLDTIAADPRTIFSIPVVVDGDGLSWPKVDLSSTDRGKIDAWLSAQKLEPRPAGERSPGKIAEHLMLQVAGRLPAKGVLDGWRVHW